MSRKSSGSSGSSNRVAADAGTDARLGLGLGVDVGGEGSGEGRRPVNGAGGVDVDGDVELLEVADVLRARRAGGVQEGKPRQSEQFPTVACVADPLPGPALATWFSSDAHSKVCDPGTDRAERRSIGRVTDQRKRGRLHAEEKRTSSCPLYVPPLRPGAYLEHCARVIDSCFRSEIFYITLASSKS